MTTVFAGCCLVLHCCSAESQSTTQYRYAGSRPVAYCSFEESEQNMTDMAAEFPVPYPCSADSDMTTQTDTTAGAAGICLDLGRCSTKSDNITQHR